MELCRRRHGLGRGEHRSVGCTGESPERAIRPNRETSSGTLSTSRRCGRTAPMPRGSFSIAAAASMPLSSCRSPKSMHEFQSVSSPSSYPNALVRRASVARRSGGVARQTRRSHRGFPSVASEFRGGRRRHGGGRAPPPTTGGRTSGERTSGGPEVVRLRRRWGAVLGRLNHAGCTFA